VEQNNRVAAALVAAAAASVGDEDDDDDGRVRPLISPRRSAGRCPLLQCSAARCHGPSRSASPPPPLEHRQAAVAVWRMHGLELSCEWLFGMISLPAPLRLSAPFGHSNRIRSRRPQPSAHSTRPFTAAARPLTPRRTRTRLLPTATSANTSHKSHATHAIVVTPADPNRPRARPPPHIRRSAGRQPPSDSLRRFAHPPVMSDAVVKSRSRSAERRKMAARLRALTLRHRRQPSLPPLPLPPVMRSAQRQTQSLSPPRRPMLWQPSRRTRRPECSRRPSR